MTANCSSGGRPAKPSFPCCDFIRYDLPHPGGPTVTMASGRSQAGACWNRSARIPETPVKSMSDNGKSQNARCRTACASSWLMLHCDWSLGPSLGALSIRPDLSNRHSLNLSFTPPMNSLTRSAVSGFDSSFSALPMFFFTFSSSSLTSFCFSFATASAIFFTAASSVQGRGCSMTALTMSSTFWPWMLKMSSPFSIVSLQPNSASESAFGAASCLNRLLSMSKIQRAGSAGR